MKTLSAIALLCAFHCNIALGACKLLGMTPIPVTMMGTRPTVVAKINGEEVTFLADSGAFYSMMSPAAAAEHHLKLKQIYGMRVGGVGGSTGASLTTVSSFTLANVTLHDVEFLVGGSEAGNGVAGMLGQNIFQIGDVEYDLADGVIRLMKVDDCKTANMAYWVKSGDVYSVMDINWTNASAPHTTGVAYLNGAKIKVMFDTGASISVLSLRAAERAGLKPHMPNVIEGGIISGIGSGTVPSYLGHFSSLKVGDEEIHNARLRFADVDIGLADMMLGADFFLSHRVYVATSQHKLYFTYSGGPVFNLSQSPGAEAPGVTAGVPRQGSGDASPPAGEAQAADKDAGNVSAGTTGPADAADLSRRGMAFAGRGDFAHALADLTQAHDLEPADPEYSYQRGLIYAQDGQLDRAAADLSRALEIKPDHLQALMARANVRIKMRDSAAAKTDLDAVDRLLADQSDLRLGLAYDYARASFLAESIKQYDTWLTAHPHDAKVDLALNSRCRTRAWLGSDLDLALRDCNTVMERLRLADEAPVRDSRALVRLRLGEYDKAISDYDKSLQLDPKGSWEPDGRAWSLYGRGIAKIRSHRTAEGEADVAEAVKITPTIADDFKRYGFWP